LVVYLSARKTGARKQNLERARGGQKEQAEKRKKEAEKPPKKAKETIDKAETRMIRCDSVPAKMREAVGGERLKKTSRRTKNGVDKYASVC
jgi:hypothetical protein